jgi:uncharacterized alkaline shock family protein YloU
LEQSSDYGDIMVNDNVIASLVRRAALSVPGVSRLSGSSLIDNIAEFVGSSKGRTISISKESADSDAVVLEVKINMLFGFKVREVAEAVQRAVIEDVETTTGMTVAKVTVVVQKIEETEEAADASSTGDAEL